MVNSPETRLAVSESIVRVVEKLQGHIDATEDERSTAEMHSREYEQAAGKLDGLFMAIKYLRDEEQEILRNG